MRMPEGPTSSVGRRIVAADIPAGSSPGVTAEAASRILLALRARLGRWIGVDAFDALLERALSGARGGALAGVRWAPGSAPPLTGLDDAGSTPDAEALRDAVAATLDELTALLGRFIGDDLATRLVLHDWEGRPSDPEGNP